MARQEGISHVELQDPPPPRVGKYNWSAIADKVRSQPLQWFRVFEDDKHSLTVSVRQNNVKSLRKDLGFVFRTSNTRHVDGTRYCSFYIQYDPTRDTTKQKRST